ncbi:MAG: UbiA prenyltransferase family protein [Nitrospirae bacterium]|uniref:UbiA prenyltransferase family protein n=1 Tax=Candidatus Magnetobacterium casense TaxID=1455061 RepID=UPI000591615C|nr:UbiA prenyltransferase family protein [Candidatus Magnetobacterium casensis]MBF0337550.1 UbiA prenyltransferase family protein [Nitrospirota bacterium]
MNLRPYIQIARPDHWFKNVFMLPGLAIATLMETNIPQDSLKNAVIGFISASLVASANYVINEYIDAEFDRHHPTKKNRPAAAGLVTLRFVVLQYILLVCVGLALAMYVGRLFTATAAFLLVMGVIYNVPPIRSKDYIYVDVLTESINNPIRLVLGWGIVIETYLPPASALLCYWFGGAFLMAVKRFSEYRFINDHERAGLYRRSFAHYTADRLLLSSFFYAITSSLFLGIFLIKYRIEFIMSFPLFAALFTWYLKIGLQHNSPAQRPQQLFTQVGFMVFVALLAVFVMALFFLDIPILHTIFTRNIGFSW